MVNFLNLIDVWDIIEKGYSPKYNTGTEVLTNESQLEKTKNESAINVILNFVSEQIAMNFGNSSNARDMWLALLNRYEGNTQIKRTKLNSLETQFENFRIEYDESIDDMYSRLMGIQNEFINYGEPLSNNKIVGKLLREIMKRPRWEALVSTLEIIQGTNDTLTPDEVFTNLRCFEEKLQQADELEIRSKNVALAGHNIKHYNPSSSQSNRDNFV